MANEKDNTLKVELPLWVKAIPVLGLGAGLFYAWKKKKSVMGYVGYGLLGGFVGGLIVTPIAIKKGAKAIGDDLAGQIKGDVKTESAPTSSPAPATNSASKRTELIAKLKDSMKNGSLTLNFDDSFFNSLSDKELLTMVIMGDVEKAKSDEDGEAIMKRNNITPNDLKVIGQKMKSYFDKLKK